MKGLHVLLIYPYTNVKKMVCPKRNLVVALFRNWLVGGVQAFQFCRGDKSPMQKDFFKNMGNLLPTLRFLGRLYNFCNFAIYIFFEEWHFADSEMIEYYQKMCGWSSKFTKTKNSVANCTRYTMLKIISYGFCWD